jgi:hypothetical protein
MANDLTPVVENVIARSQDQKRIMPTWVANESYIEIDPDLTSPLLVRHGCTEHLKQIARSILHKKLEPSESDIIRDQLELWELQIHYPSVEKTSDGDPVYVHRDYMTEADILFNYNRMDKAGDSLKAHARKLLQFGIDRGVLSQKAA